MKNTYKEILAEKLSSSCYCQIVYVLIPTSVFISTMKKGMSLICLNFSVLDWKKKVVKIVSHRVVMINKLIHIKNFL